MTAHRYIPCPDCGGDGWVARPISPWNSRPAPCETCHGVAEIEVETEESEEE